MTTRSAAASLALLLAPFFLLTALGRVSAEFRFCCPKTVFYSPWVPRITYKHFCPKRICPGCELPNFGYYPTCWQPWPYPPNYSHCPVPPISLFVTSSPTAVPTDTAPTEKLEQLPPPSKIIPEPNLQKMSGRGQP